MFEIQAIAEFVKRVESMLDNDLEIIATIWEENEDELREYIYEVDENEGLLDLMNQTFVLIVDLINNADQESIDDYREQVADVLGEIVTLVDA